MTIRTNISTSIRRPGRFIDFRIDTAARGLTPLSTRIALVGVRASTGSVAVGIPTQVFTAADADEFFGLGSELALMCRWAIRASLDYGKSPEIWAVAMAAPAGAAATQTITIAGSPSGFSELVLRIAGREVRASVAIGDSTADIALAVKEVIDTQRAELPVTATVAGAVVSSVHVTTGVNGNDVGYELIQLPTGVTVASVQATAGVGAADISSSLDLLEDADYDIVAIANHAAGDVADLAAHIRATWAPGTKRWRHTLMAEHGTLATSQTLASAADDYRQMALGAQGYRNTPAEIAAYVGTMLAAEDDPALPWNDVELPSLYLPPKPDIPTTPEIESALAGGVFILGVNERQTRAKIIRAITTKVTEGGVPFFELLDYTVSRSLYFGGRQIDIAVALAFPRAKKSERTQNAVRSVVLKTMEQLEEIEVWENVAEHAGALLVEPDATVSSRLNVAVPADVVEPLNQLAMVFNLLV